MNKTLSGKLKNKGMSSWSIPKVVAVACESNSLQSLSHSSNQGFHEGGRKAGRLRMGSQGLLWLYCITCFAFSSGRGGSSGKLPIRSV